VLGIIVIAVMLTGIGVALYLSRPSRITAALLNVRELPSSLRNSECSSLLSQDTITTCSFEIDPADASHLIAGWPYSSRIVGAGSSDELGWGLRVGKSFAVSVIYDYSADPGAGPYPHTDVSLIFNAERNRGMVTFFGL